MDVNDLRLQNPFRLMLAGSSGCGKTTKTLKLLQNAESVFSDPRCMQNVIYFYKQDQSFFKDFKPYVHKWVNQLPNEELIESLANPYKDSGGSIMILDDFQNNITTDIENLFAAGSHHLNISVILIVQNLFYKEIRHVAGNVQYMIVFRNPRAASQFRILAQQLTAGSYKWLLDSFLDATSKPYSYIFIDSHQDSPEVIKYRTNIFADEGEMIVYKKRGD